MNSVELKLMEEREQERINQQDAIEEFYKEEERLYHYLNNICDMIEAKFISKNQVFDYISNHTQQ